MGRDACHRYPPGSGVPIPRCHHSKRWASEPVRISLARGHPPWIDSAGGSSFDRLAAVSRGVVRQARYLAALRDGPAVWAGFVGGIRTRDLLLAYEVTPRSIVPRSSLMPAQKWSWPVRFRCLPAHRFRSSALPNEITLSLPQPRQSRS